MGMMLPAAAFAAAVWFGVASKLRMYRQAKILAAAYEFSDQVRFFLSGSCMPTVEILMQSADTSIGRTLPCLKKTVEATRNGEDLYTAWEREVKIFCKENRIAATDAALIRKTVLQLGSLDLLGCCTAYDELTDALQKRKEQAEEKNKTQGTAALKIGLLCGLGLSLLLWQP